VRLLICHDTVVVLTGYLHSEVNEDVELSTQLLDHWRGIEVLSGEETFLRDTFAVPPSMGRRSSASTARSMVLALLGQERECVELSLPFSLLDSIGGVGGIREVAKAESLDSSSLEDWRGFGKALLNILIQYLTPFEWGSALAMGVDVL
jgi:hypothetical protein